MADVSAAFSERKVNIEKANIRTLSGGEAVWDLVVDVGTAEELDQIIRVVSAIPDVLAVSRPGPSANPRSAPRRPARTARRGVPSK
jgi:(p)ppGpp synthase/HD superfamily hydrolase